MRINEHNWRLKILHSSVTSLCIAECMLLPTFYKTEDFQRVTVFNESDLVNAHDDFEQYGEAL